MVSVKEGDRQMVILYGKDIAALIILFISFIGICGNTTVAVFTRKLPTMNNPFGRLLASQATGEAILCSGFFFFYFPLMFWDSQWMLDRSGTVGYIQLICYDICVWSHFFISINRFVAICLPLKYDQVFSKRNTWIIIIFTWTVAIVFETVLHYVKFFSESCTLIVSSQLWAYVFETNEMDTISATQRIRRKREVSFLKQAVLQMLVFCAELSTYFVLSTYFLDNRWIFWVLTTFAWCTVHTVDGIIILLFNREFRKLITSPLRNLCKFKNIIRLVIDSWAVMESSEQITGNTPNCNRQSSTNANVADPF